MLRYMLCFSYLYWTEWGRNPRLARMQIAVGSSSVQTVGPTGLKWPNALFVSGNVLYIADGHPTERRLFNCSLPGSRHYKPCSIRDTR